MKNCEDHNSETQSFSISVFSFIIYIYIHSFDESFAYSKKNTQFLEHENTFYTQEREIFFGRQPNLYAIWNLIWF